MTNAKLKRELERLAGRIEKQDDLRGRRNELIREAAIADNPQKTIAEWAGVSDAYVRKCINGTDRAAA